MTTLTPSDDKARRVAIDAEDEALGPCTVCGGKKSEHVNSIHAYTNMGGVLVTKEAVERAEKQQKPIVIAGPQSQIMTRLIETLVAKNILNNDDLMYITGLRGQEHGNGS
jgi:hypothetical protein